MDTIDSHSDTTDDAPSTGLNSAEVIGLIGPEVRERVVIAPPAPWVALHEVDDAFEPASRGSSPLLLVDCQHHAALGARYERTVQRLETMQAVHDAAQWRFEFDPRTQRVAIHSLLVRRGGTGVEHAQPARLRFLYREENLERLVVNGRITVVVLLEDVRIGDILDASMTVDTTRRLLAERYWFLAPVPSDAALREYRLSVRFPTDYAMRWKSSSDDFPPAVRNLEDETEWSWRIENVAAIHPEPGVPTWHVAGQWIQVSDCTSWAEVAAGVLQTWQEDFADRELTRACQEIAASSATAAECVERAVVLVQDEVRYLSVNIDLGGQIPAPPGVVLRRRFGDCKDKSFLLVHLLRRLGIPARPALVHAQLRDAVEQLLPMPDAFNHAVVEYELEGERRFVDVTIPLQGGGPLGRPIPEFVFSLPIGPGVTRMERLLKPESDDSYELHETFTLGSATAGSTLQVLITAHGWEAEQLRRNFALEGCDAVARRREQFYQQLFPKAQRIGTLEWRDNRRRNELLLAERFHVPDAIAPSDDPKLHVFSHHAHLIQAALRFPEMGSRRQPFALPYPCEFTHRIDLVWPSLTRSQTQARMIREPEFRFALEPLQAHGRWTATYKLRMMVNAVAPERFEEFKQKVRELWPHTHLRIALPSGVTGPARKRIHGGLLPPIPDFATNDARAPGPLRANDGEFAALLANEPAAPLASLTPRVSSPTPATDAVTAPAQAKVNAPVADSNQQESAPPGHHGSRRRRRSRKRLNWQLLIALTVIVAAVAAVLLVFLLP